MPKRSSLILLSLLSVVVFCANTYASVPSVHISAKPAWLNTYKVYNKKIPLRDVNNGYFYQLLEEQVQVEKQADYIHIIKEIVSEAGIQNGSEISISFDPSYETLNVHTITVWRNNVAQNRLSAGSFKMIADEKELSKFIYQGTYSAYCILSDIRKGDRIEYAYTLTGRNPILEGKYCRNMYLQQSLPVAHLYKSIMVSPSRKLNFKYFNNPPKTNEFVKNGLKCYEWEAYQVQPATDYDNQVGWYTSYNYIQISEFSSWKEVAAWAAKINPIATHITGKLADRIAKFKADAGNDKEKFFRSAVKMVQDEVRYMGVETGQYSHKANKPEIVYNQRYGDCKDKSLLLASVLNAAGIPAHMVLINTSTLSKTAQYLPSAYDFDHATVVATVNNKQVWIDPTISYQRGTGINLYYPDYGQGLIVDNLTDSLAAIPHSKTGIINCQERYTVPDKGAVRLEVVTTYSLNEADKVRDKLASAGISATEKSYLDYYAKYYPKIESKDSITIKDNEDKNELITIEHYLITDFFKKDSVTNKLVASFYADYISDQVWNVNNKLKYPIVLNYPCNVDYTIGVVLPSGWNIDESRTALNNDLFTFASKTSAVKDTLFLNYKFKYLQSFVPVNQLSEYVTAIKKIKDEYLGYSFSYLPGVVNSIYRINYWMVLSIIIFTIGVCVLGIKIYRTPTPEVLFERGAGFQSLGGWLLFIAFGLFISILSLIISLSKGVYFDLNSWNSHSHSHTEYTFKTLFTFEAFCNVFLVCYSLFCLILLLNKRDILPRFIIGLYAFATVFFLTDYIAGKLIFNNLTDDSSAYALIRVMIASAIWIPYFKRSSRVEETFVVPYPSTNYRYEEYDGGYSATVEAD